ncbi:MAG: DNA methyltransferase, partial [Chloroflexota bacterium]
MLTTAQTPPSLSQAVTLAPLPPAEQRAIAQEVDFAQTTVRDLREIVRERKEAKSHREAHAERLAQYEAAVQASRPAQPEPAAPDDPEPDTEEAASWPLYDAICRSDALSYLRDLPDGCAHLCVTSPPYWAKRQYTDGDPLELGREADPNDYVARLVEIVNEIGRVLAPGASLFLNLGDTYASQPGQYRGNPDRARGISPLAVQANGTALAGRVLDVPEKSLAAIPWRVLLALILGHGWRCANVIAWVKEGALPENVRDRLTQRW